MSPKSYRVSRILEGDAADHKGQPDGLAQAGDGPIEELVLGHVGPARGPRPLLKEPVAGHKVHGVRI